MQGVLLTEQSTIGLALTDGGLILFGLLLVLYGFSLAVVFLLRQAKQSWGTLAATQVLTLCVLGGILALDLSGASGALYTIQSIEHLSELLSTHRWLLIQVPVLLLLASLIVLVTYREHIANAYATRYRVFLQIATVFGFASVLLIGFESML